MINLIIKRRRGREGGQSPHAKDYKYPTVVALISLEKYRDAHGANWPDARQVRNFAMDNGQEASRCGQDWLRNCEVLVLYMYQLS